LEASQWLFTDCLGLPGTLTFGLITIPTIWRDRKTTQLAPGFAIFNLLESDFKIDLAHSIKAFKEEDFNACFHRAKIADYKGVDVPVMDATDLLTEKIKTNRLKDLVDIDFLKKLLKLK